MPQSPFGSGSGARFRMPADYARRLNEARHFSHTAERSPYLGQTNQRDGTAQNPGVGHAERKLLVAMFFPEGATQRLTYGLVSYAALTVAEDPTRAERFAMQAIACLMNADIQVLTSAGCEEGGIQLMSTAFACNPQLLLQALAIEATYNTDWIP